jgi:hypothetical protein
MSNDAKHPPPWRWEDGALRDARGEALIWSRNPHDSVEAWPRVKALTELAPEMEALLRSDPDLEFFRSTLELRGNEWVAKKNPERYARFKAILDLLARIPPETP